MDYQYRHNEEWALDKLFDVVRHFVLLAGGDGDGWIICHDEYNDYQDLANKFEKFENENGKWFTNKGQAEGCVTFYNNQESISFINSREKLPKWASDIIVEI